jgi:hypothetical protein
MTAKIVTFPKKRRGLKKQGAEDGSAVIILLPIIRVERYAVPVAKKPKRGRR